ncbi:hypothetical protein EDC04DRAFT_2605291 [Pisolithus marmoratus]|nr:hypothetical protein EDC04DRAFT_2605291 [Pisolithus marmoratus]
MSIIDQVKVNIVSPTHDSDNARQLGAGLEVFCEASIGDAILARPINAGPRDAHPSVDQKGGGPRCKWIDDKSACSKIWWSCTAYRHTTHPFGTVKKNLACANMGLGAVTEWQDIVKIAWHGTDSIMLNPVNVCIEHHVSQRLSAQHHPSTRCGKLCHLSIGHIWQWPILHLDQLPILQLDQSPISYWAISHSTIDRIGCLEK